MQTILIIGLIESPEVQSLYKIANERGVNVLIIDSATIGTSLSIEYYPENDQVNIAIRSCAQNRPSNTLIALADISGIYCAKINPPSGDSSQALERSCLFQLLLNHGNINWVNSVKAIQFHRTKPKQLHLASRLGARIPHTYIGQQEDAIDVFLAKHKDVIVKPVFSGGLTYKLSPNQRQASAIPLWANQAVTLQEYIPGKDIRTYIVGDFIVSAEIQTANPTSKTAKPSLDHSSIYQEHELDISDYRQYPNAKMKPIILPLEIQQLAMRIARAFHLKFTAIDWRLRPSGEYIFLEANPAPLFVYAQKQLGIEIDKALIGLLTQ